MSTDGNERFGVEAVDESRIRTVVKLLLIAVTLIVLWALFSALPGLEQLAPGTPISYSAVGGAIVTLGLVVVLGYVALRVEPLVKSSVSGPSDLVEDGAAILKYFLGFVAVIVAYQGFDPLVTPMLAVVELVWVYDALFLVLAVIPMAIIGWRMWQNLDATTEFIVDHLTASSDGNRSDSEESTRS